MVEPTDRLLSACVGPLHAAVALGVAVMAYAPSARAQRLTPSGVIAREAYANRPPARAMRDTLPPMGRGGRAISGGVIGLVAGAAVGAGTAYVMTHRRSTTDHGYDPVAYMVLVPVGSVVGVIAGAVIGASMSP
jgi:hypothetical protein